MHKQFGKSVFGSVGQPISLRPVCIAQLIQVELFGRRLRLAQIQDASLPNSRFYMLFVYRNLMARKDDQSLLQSALSEKLNHRQYFLHEDFLLR